jgi:hypothetical protein
MFPRGVFKGTAGQGNGRPGVLVLRMPRAAGQCAGRITVSAMCHIGGGGVFFGFGVHGVLVF